jgi:hypothetical protein
VKGRLLRSPVAQPSTDRTSGHATIRGPSYPLIRTAKVGQAPPKTHRIHDHHTCSGYIYSDCRRCKKAVQTHIILTISNDPWRQSGHRCMLGLSADCIFSPSPYPARIVPRNHINTFWISCHHLDATHAQPLLFPPWLTVSRVSSFTLIRPLSPAISTDNRHLPSIKPT